mgnify:CR=1 FL=1
MIEFEEILRSAETEIKIIGTNGLIPHLENSGALFCNLLTLNKYLVVGIYYESDNENFNQSLCLDSEFSGNRISYSTLSIHRDRIKGFNDNTGLKADIINRFETIDEKNDVDKRIVVKQINLRLPSNLIKVDDKIYFVSILNSLPEIKDK